MIDVYPDLAALARAAAGEIVARGGACIAAQGRFSIVLAGGSTPRPVYALLASDEFAGQVDWARVHVFWGDERCVPPDHPDSNFRMARETLLDHVPVPSGQIYRMRGESEPAQAAAEYEAALRAFFQPHAAPRFDLVLLGLGSDAHTASLFPGTAALAGPTRWAVENYVPRLAAWRITLTAGAINAAAGVMFLAAGGDKAEALRAVLQEPFQPETYPAQLIKPGGDRAAVRWLVDAAAAELLSTGREDFNQPGDDRVHGLPRGER